VEGDRVVVCRTVVVTIVVAVDVDGPVVEGAVVVTTVVVTTVVDDGVVVTTVDSTTAPPPGVCVATGAAGVVTDIWFDSALALTVVTERNFTSYVVDRPRPLITNGDVIDPAGKATQVVPPSSEYS